MCFRMVVAQRPYVQSPRRHAGVPHHEPARILPHGYLLFVRHFRRGSSNAAHQRRDVRNPAAAHWRDGHHQHCYCPKPKLVQPRCAVHHRPCGDWHWILLARRALRLAARKKHINCAHRLLLGGGAHYGARCKTRNRNYVRWYLASLRGGLASAYRNGPVLLRSPFGE